MNNILKKSWCASNNGYDVYGEECDRITSVLPTERQLKFLQSTGRRSKSPEPENRDYQKSFQSVSGKTSDKPVGKADSFFGVHHSYIIYPDKTDTWSHSVDRYPASGGMEMQAQKSFSFNRGALFSDTRTTFSSGGNLVNGVPVAF